VTGGETARHFGRFVTALNLGWFTELTARCRQLFCWFTASPAQSAPDRRGLYLVDTTDSGMLQMLSCAVLMHRSLSRWERTALRATIGMHATRVRRAGMSGEQGLTRFKEILQRTSA
jgi:hypothetical protein